MAVFVVVHLHLDFAGTGICRDNVPVHGNASRFLVYAYFPKVFQIPCSISRVWLIGHHIARPYSRYSYIASCRNQSKLLYDGHAPQYLPAGGGQLLRVH